MKLFHKYREQIVYVIVGLMTTIVSWGTHFLLFSMRAHLFILATLPTVVAIAFAFFTNKWWVFRSVAKDFETVFREAITFVGSRGIMGLFEAISILVLVNLGFDRIFFSTEAFDARLVVSVVVVIGNYFISKFWVFKQKNAEEGL